MGRVLTDEQIRKLNKVVPQATLGNVKLGELLDFVASGDNLVIGELATQVSGLQYKTAYPFVSGKLQVYIDGLLAKATDITEDDADAGTFTLDEDPGDSEIYTIYTRQSLPSL